MRALPLALLATLSTLGMAEETRAADVTTPLVLSQAEDDDPEVEPTEDQEDAWRVYLDLYAFLPLQTTSTTTINDNSSTLTLPLSDVFNTLDGALTFKAAAEYGRLSFMAAVNHASNSASTSQSSWREINNPLRNQLGLPSVLRQREIRIDNDVDVDINTNQTVVDLALRYRAGAIQKPRMAKGSSSVQGLLGARIIDANLNTDVNFRRRRTVEVDGVLVSRKRTRELQRSASASWGNTWVQPLIGVFGTYAISEDWQAFAYLDAGGFGLSGERDLSGTAQAGIAYALGNSAQASLSYKYFGLDYAAGSGNGYRTDQSGINLGLRWLFD